MSKLMNSRIDPTRRGLWRSRWAAIGAAVAVSLGAGGFFVAQAAPDPAESTVVTVSPERILDTRDPNNIGLTGPFVSAAAQKLQVTGSIPTATGTKVVVPTGATGVLLNVTPVNPTAAGFISIRPGDATGAATTSSLNFTTGIAGIVPNAVQVAVPTAGTNAGKIDITYDAYGVTGPTTDILIDVVGYMTNKGLQELVAHGDIVESHGLALIAVGASAPLTNIGGVAGLPFNGTGQQSLVGPESIGGVPYGLKSVTYCVNTPSGDTVVDTVTVLSRYAQPDQFVITDGTNRNAAGCYTLQVNNSSSDSYAFLIDASGTAGSVVVTSLTTTWAPASTLPAPLASEGLPPELDALLEDVFGS